MQKLFLLVCVLFWNCDSYASVSSSSQEGTQEIKINNVMVVVSNNIAALIEQHASAIEAQFNFDSDNHMICFDYRKLMYEIYFNITTYVNIECVLLDPALFNSQPDTDRHFLYDSCMEWILKEFDQFLELYRYTNFLVYVDDSFVQCFKKIPLDQLFTCSNYDVTTKEKDHFSITYVQNQFSQLCDQFLKSQKNLPAYQHINSYFEIKYVCSDISDQKLCDIVVKKLVAIEQQQGKKLFLGDKGEGFCGSIMSFKNRFVDCYDAYIDALAEQYGVSQGLSAQYPKSLVMSCFVEDASFPKDSETIESMIIESMEAELIYFQKNKQLLPKTLKILQTPLLIHGGSAQAVESSSVTGSLIQTSGMSYAFIKSCTQTMLNESAPFFDRKKALIVLHTALFNQKFNGYDSEVSESKVNFNYEEFINRIFDDLKSHIKTIPAIMQTQKIWESLKVNKQDVSKALNIDTDIRKNNLCIASMCDVLYSLRKEIFNSLHTSKMLHLLTDDFMQCIQKLFMNSFFILKSKPNNKLVFNCSAFIDYCMKAIDHQLQKPAYQHIRQRILRCLKPVSHADENAFNPSKDDVKQFQESISRFISDIEIKLSGKIKFNYLNLFSNLYANMSEKIQESLNSFKFYYNESDTAKLYMCMNQNMLKALHNFFIQVLNKENLRLVDDNFIQCINAKLLTGCFIVHDKKDTKSLYISFNEPMFVANCTKAFENQMHHYEEQYRVRCKKLSEFKFLQNDFCFDIAVKMLVSIEVVQNFKIIFDYKDLVRLREETFYLYEESNLREYLSYIESLRKQYNLEHGLSDRYPKSFTISPCIIDETEISNSDKASSLELLKKSLDKHNTAYRKIIQNLAKLRENTALGSTVQSAQQVIQSPSDALKCASNSSVDTVVSAAGLQQSVKPELPHNLEHGLSDQYPKSFTISPCVIDETKISNSDKASLLKLLKKSLDKHNETYRTIIQNLAKLEENTDLESTVQSAQKVTQPPSDGLKCASKSPVDTVVSAAGPQQSVKPELPSIALPSSEPQSWKSGTVEDSQRSARLTDVEINQQLLLIQLAEMQARIALQQESTNQFFNIMSNRSKPLGRELGFVRTQLTKAKTSLEDMKKDLEQVKTTLIEQRNKTNELTQAAQNFGAKNISANELVEKLKTKKSDISKKLMLSQTELETTKIALQKVQTDAANQTNHFTVLETSLQSSTANNAALLEAIKKTQVELEQEFAQSTESSVLQGQAQSNVQSVQEALQQILERCKRVKTQSDEENLAFNTKQKELQKKLQESTTNFALRAGLYEALQADMHKIYALIGLQKTKHGENSENTRLLDSKKIEDMRTKNAEAKRKIQDAICQMTDKHNGDFKELKAKVEKIEEDMSNSLKPLNVETQTDF